MEKSKKLYGQKLPANQMRDLISEYYYSTDTINGYMKKKVSQKIIRLLKNIGNKVELQNRKRPL